MRRIVVVLLVASLAAGCGGNKQGAAPSPTNVQTLAATPQTPAGFTVRAVRSEGLSIAVPRPWRSIDASTALRGAAVKRFERENPAAAAAVEALARPNSPMKLVAVDPSPSGGFATNVNVLVSRIPSGASFEQWTKAETEQIAALNPTNLAKATVQLPAGKAYRLAYHARLLIRGSSRELALRQYMVKRGASLYVVTFTTSAGRVGALTPTFERSARTFDLTG